MPKRLRLPAVLVTALVVAEAAVLLLRPRERYPRELVEARAYFSAEELAKAVRFRNGQFLLFAGQTAIELAVLVAAVRWAPRAGQRPVLKGALTAAALSAATTAAALPLRAVARERAKGVGLVTQSWGGWAADVAKGTALGGALTAAGGAALVLGMRRFGRTWWAPGAAAVAGFAVVFTFAGPIVLDPIFNRFTPLPAGRARDDVLELARKAGVDVGEVYEVDASRRTTAANAYVNGIGRTKRVVLYDTLLEDFTPAETRLVIAHELGHVHYRDVPHGLLWLALVAPFATLAVARAAERLQREGATPVPAVALSLALLAPAVGVVSNQLSRAIERRADDFALRITGEPEAMVAFERRITLQNVGDPDPPHWRQVLLGTHPDTLERIGAALAYEEPVP
ncbi:M48 family metalloprotease [Candidatus Solirubrobacter pratensis]|uniref:M48 family metalloprotease n=1 Tax=Candidatus Solirubrobacter pratensis TaxID=1298857 RepID=UPI0004062A98|nr:M48 family metalloprotease [Candidatus Solirubrobacter pratensis]